jgi:hypothetical protein
VAAECYAPNVPLAGQRLEPLGVQVVWTDGNCHNSRGPQPGNRWPLHRLPFADDTFDLVLASRAAYRERLFRLHRRMQAEGGFRTRVYTNLIEAQKP